MLISEKHKEITQWALEYAMKNGCSAVRVSLIVSSNNSFEYRNVQLDTLQQSSENKLFLELFVNGSYGTFSTNRIEKEELKWFIKEAIISTRFLSPDFYRQLPDPDRYYKFKGGDLDLVDSTYPDLSTDRKIGIIKESVDEIYGSDARLISVSSSYSDGYSSEYILASNGFEAEIEDTAFSLSVEVALKGDGDSRPESFWYDSTVYWNDLQKRGLAKKAFERAKGKIGQKKIKSGRYNMLLDNLVSSRLLVPVISAMYGVSIQQKNSFLIDKLGEKIASKKLTLIDDPHVKRRFGARWFDNEGVATYKNTFVKEGVLNSYFIDTYSSLKMNVPPTISSPSIVRLEAEGLGFEDMIKNMFNGIWVTDFNGGNCNPTTGDFSFGIEGFLIERGTIIQPINEMNITGNMYDLWNSLIEVGNDPRMNSSWLIPSLLFMDINFNGA